MPDVQSPAATLASLHPRDVMEKHFASYKNSQSLQGSHFLSLKRASKSPMSSRHYFPGDPVRMIDWKAYARTDQLIIREERDEAKARVSIFVSHSPSMNWPDHTVSLDGREPRPKKIEIALRMAFHMAATHLQMGDDVWIWPVAPSDKVYPRTVFKPQNLNQCFEFFHFLENQHFSLSLNSHFLSEAQQASTRPYDVAYWISDLIESDFEELQNLVKAKRKHICHLLSSLELDVEWMNAQTCFFYDAQVEGGSYRENFGSDLKADQVYLEHLKAWQKECVQKAHNLDAHYELFSDQTLLQNYLSYLFGYS